MIINDRLRKRLFLVMYSLVTALLIVNAIRFKILIDTIYTIIFVCIYIRYVYISLT